MTILPHSGAINERETRGTEEAIGVSSKSVGQEWVQDKNKVIIGSLWFSKESEREDELLSPIDRTKGSHQKINPVKLGTLFQKGVS